jgi:hypothetical protein
MRNFLKIEDIRNEEGDEMLVTKDILPEKLTNYLNGEISLNDLVNWTEKMLCEEDFDKKVFQLIRDILARLGLAEVKELGLSKDSREYLHRLGHTATVTIS